MRLDDADSIPVQLSAQFRRHMPRYLAGVVLLGGYQTAQWWFDVKLQLAINAATDGEHEIALHIGGLLVAVALAALVIRILSRVIVFNAGRIAEYELRTALLARLLRLGSAFYQKMPVGEIMSRGRTF